MFSYDSTGIETKKKYTPIPAGEYDLVITKVTPKLTKNKDSMINVEMEVEGGDYNERKVWTNITFFKDKASKGAGIALHFLDCIGEPWEGKFEVDEENWVGKRVKAKVIIENYEGDDRNAIRYFIKPLGENGKAATGAGSTVEEEIPF